MEKSPFIFNFFHKFCPAFWTGNADFSSAFWHSHFLFTLRTFVKSVVFSLCQMLFEPVPLHSHLISVVEIFLIFCISCGNILREHSPCGIDHQRDRQPVKNAKTAEHRQKSNTSAAMLCAFASSSAPYLPIIKRCIFSLIVPTSYQVILCYASKEIASTHLLSFKKHFRFL